jgi:UDP-glucuronate 4-epimerase
MKVLVTGAAGFIGAKVCELLDDSIEIIGIDNLNDYYDVALKNYRLNNLKLKKNFKFIKTDIENLEGLEKIFKDNKFDVTYNLAARAGVRASLENPFIYESTNCLGNLNLLELAKKYSVPKFILASTSSLYAGLATPFTENLEVNTPISPYAATKKSAEVMCYTYHSLYNIDVSIVRYFTVYGPAGRPDMAPFRFTSGIVSGSEIEIYGDGNQSRDFTYVDDIALGTILASKKLGYEIINLGGGNKPYTLHDLISRIEKYSKKTARIKKSNLALGDMLITWADITKAKKLLNWEPQVSFDEGIQKMVEWHLGFNC